MFSIRLHLGAHYLDTGAETNLVHADVLPRSALDTLKINMVCKVRDESRKALNILGELLYIPTVASYRCKCGCMGRTAGQNAAY